MTSNLFILVKTFCFFTFFLTNCLQKWSFCGCLPPYTFSFHCRFIGHNYVAGTIEVCIILYYMFRYVCMSSILVKIKSHAVYSWMFPILVYFWDLH